MKLKLFFMLIVICTAFSGKGQEAILNFESALKIATDSSLQSFKAKNLYLVQYWQYKNFKANLRPNVYLSSTPAEYSRTFVKRYNSTNNVDEYRAQQNLYSDVSITASQNIGITGGSIFATTSLNRLQNFGDSITYQYNSVPFQIGYKQSLFGFNSIKWEKKIAPLQYEKAKMDLIKEMESINVNTTNYYFDYLSAEQQLQMAEINMANADTLYKIGEQRYSIVSISQSELFTLKTQLLDAKNNRAKAEKDLNKAKYYFTSYLRFKNANKYTLLLPESLPALVINSEEALQYALKNNPDILEQQQLILQSERDLESTKVQSRFNSSISASFGLNQTNSTVTGAYTKPQNQQLLSVSLYIPLIDWGTAKGKYNIAKSNLEIQKIASEQAESDFKQTVLIAVSDFNLQSQIVATAKERSEYAEKAFLLCKQRFMTGKEDVNGLILAQSRQDNAKIEYINSLRSFWVYFYNIRMLTLFDFVNNIAITNQMENLFKE